MHADLFHPWPVLRPMREVRTLLKARREVCVLSWIKDTATALPEREDRDGVEVHRVKLAPPTGFLGRAFGYRRVSRQFALEIERLQPEAIVCHDLEMLWASAMAAKRLRVPLLYNTHEDWPAMVSERSRLEGFAFSLLERRLVRHVDHVYVVGEEFAGRYRAWGKPVTVQYGSKALGEMPRLTAGERAAARAELNFAPEDIVVGIAGSLGRDEALPTVLEAMTRLPDGIKLFIVGGVPEKVEGARNLADRAGLASRLTWTGPLPVDAYLRRVALLDIGLALFHPTSANQRFGLPLKLFDYMGMGIPGVFSDFPAIRRVVEGCGSGILVPPGESGPLERAISDLAGDRAKRERLGAAARRCFESTYCWEQQEGALRASSPIFGGG